MLLFVTLAAADVLDSERVAVGVADDGSFCDDVAQVGLLHDPDGPGGQPVGTDLLRPGRCFEAWSLSSSAGQTVQSMGDTGGTALDWGEVLDSGDVQTWVGAGELAGAEVELTIDVPFDRPVIFLTYRVTAAQDLTDVWLSRSVDADTDFLFSDTYNTANGASDEVVWASSQVTDKALALAAVGGQGGICSWCTTASQIRSGTVGELAGDYVVGVALPLGDLLEGEQVEATFAYAFGESADEVTALALETAASDDRDGDGADASVDCDDRDASRAPGLDEVVDGVDNDCDGVIDELGDTGGWAEFVDETDDLVVRHQATETVGGCGSVAAGPWALALLLLRRRR